MQNKIRNKLGKKDRPVRIKKDLKIKDKKNDEGDGKKVKRYRDPLLNTSLKLYEKANKLQSHDEKFKVVQKLVTLLSGKINSIIFRHDMSRVVQLIFKYALPQHKTKIVNEMLSSIQLIASRKYSNHLIKSAMIHCDSSIRNLLIKELQKHTLPILRTKIGVKVLELVYKKYCNNAQRNKFKSSLIGIATVDGSSSLKQQCQVDKALTSAIMSSTKSNLNSLLQKDCCLKSSIVTSALHDYLHSCAENDKIEIKEILLPNIIDLVSTKFGSYCALEIMWICSTKEKKSIIKQLQEVCVDLSLDENGSFFILSLFDCVDDTVLLYKIILSKLMDNIRKILENDWGLRIIDYMFLHHMASNKFSLSDKEILQQSVNAGNTKKDPNKRLNEIKNSCYPSILKDITDNTDKWLNHSHTIALFNPVFKHGIHSELDFSVDLEKAFNAVAKFITNSESLINDIILHLTIKKFISLDELRVKKDQALFSQILLNNLNDDILMKWVQSNRGCFILLGLIELKIETISKIVQNFFEKSKILKSLLMEQRTAGGKVLKEKLTSRTNNENTKFKKQKIN